MSGPATNFTKILNGTISNIKDSVFVISSASVVANRYMLSQITKSKLHKQTLIIWFTKEFVPSKVLSASEIVKTEGG